MITTAVRKLALPLCVSGMLLAPSAQAVTLTLDGDLSDMIAAVSLHPGQSGSVSESGTDAEANGFDITNAYFHYDIPSDTFYIGFETFGAFGTAGGGEGNFGSPICNSGQTGNIRGVAGVFDGCESVGFSIDLNSDSSLEYQFNVRGEGIVNSGLDTEQTPVLGGSTLGAEVHWFASEANDGVEFSVTGLGLLEFPVDVTVLVSAGSISNSLPEDVASISTQVIPVPAAVWLFGSGLLGLIGMGRRRSKQTA